MSRVSFLSNVVLAVITTSPLFAQAWLLPRGEGAVSISYQNNYLPDHVFSKGERQDVGPIHVNGVLMDVDYSFTDRLAVRVALPYFAAQYAGPRPHQLPIDDGTYHGTFQDFRVGVRYNLRRRTMMLTPFFDMVIPSHAYEHYAHSAIGRRLREYQVGTNFGRRLNPVLPNAFFQVRYAYVFSETVHGLAPNAADMLRFNLLHIPVTEVPDTLSPKRSDTEFQVGYFVTPRLSLMGLGSWQHPHNGIDYQFGIYPNNLTMGQLFNHDRIALVSLLDFGGGVSFAATRSMDLFATAVTSARVRNGHALASGVTVGVSWRFRTPLSKEFGAVRDQQPAN